MRSGAWAWGWRWMLRGGFEGVFGDGAFWDGADPHPGLLGSGCARGQARRPPLKGEGSRWVAACPVSQAIDLLGSGDRDNCAWNLAAPVPLSLGLAATPAASAPVSPARQETPIQ